MDRRLAFATLSILPVLASATGVQTVSRRAAEEPRACVAQTTVTTIHVEPIQVVIVVSYPRVTEHEVRGVDLRGLSAFPTLPPMEGFEAKDFVWRSDAEPMGDFLLASKRSSPVRRTPKWASPYTRKKWYFADYQPASGEDRPEPFMRRFDERHESAGFDVSVGIAKASEGIARGRSLVESVVRMAPEGP